jgi:NAD(P)-dependent dehydrogenase (short-subunit alcohol dehydrogenase family)
MRVIITGGNSGIGKATAATLAAGGHQVIIACRTVAKGEAVAAAMTGDVEVAHLDLADLASVRKFAASINSVDVLINNAGVCALPLTRTADGFEAHFGTNHLGHFALTCLLGDRIKDRVIAVSSSTYELVKLHWDDLNWERRRYSKSAAYAESKLANLLFVDELSRRGITAYSADPGVVNSDITRDSGPVLRWSGKYIHPLVGQTTADGARSSLEAVTTELPSGTYFAPRGPLHQWGRPTPVKLRKKARDAEAARQLWEVSAQLTGCEMRPPRAGLRGTGS